MLITYASAHKWEKSVLANPMEHFGKNSKARIRSTLNKIDSVSIRHSIEEVNDVFFEWFLPKYESRITSKANPTIFDIRNKIKNASRPYYSLSLFENNKPVGATIFSVIEDRFSIAYRTYENHWIDAKLQANPSLYTEYLACTYAYSINCQTIVHGKDRNPYGPNSNIGLAAFKLAMGCQPKKSGEFDVKTVNTNSLETDSLFFKYPSDSQQEIKKGYLLTTRESAHQWIQVTKYPHLIDISIVYRD